MTVIGFGMARCDCTKANTRNPWQMNSDNVLQVTKNMDGVVRGLDKAMQSMDLEKVEKITSLFT